MTNLPNTEQQLKLVEWHQSLIAAAEAKKVIEAEQALRKEVAALFFPTPVEGVNNFGLAEGWALKLTYKLDRKVDEAALPAVFEQLRQLNVNPNMLIDTKPSLNTKGYKALREINEQAAHVFEQALIIKPSSPTLELLEPKAPKE